MDLGHQIITGERIQELCDVYCGLPDDFRFNPRIFIQHEKCINIHSIKSGWNNPRILFCYGHRLNDFRNILPFIQNNFILVTHNSDENITSTYADIADHEKLIQWHAQNLMINHAKIKMLPIGIANSMWAHGNLHALETVRKSNLPKTNSFYFYFNVSTNHRERIPCKTILEQKGLLLDSVAPDFATYLQKLTGYKYAICPPGNGVDCHRLWECVYLNVIPVLLRSVFTEKVAELFPCVLLDTWNDFDASALLRDYTTPDYSNNLDLTLCTL